MPKIASEFNRTGIQYDFVTKYLQNDKTLTEIEASIEAAAMRNNGLDVLGNYYCVILDGYTDLTIKSAVLGTHIKLIEMSELKNISTRLPMLKFNQRYKHFILLLMDCKNMKLPRLECAARTSLALEC